MPESVKRESSGTVSASFCPTDLARGSTATGGTREARAEPGRRRGSASFGDRFACDYDRHMAQ